MEEAYFPAEVFLGTAVARYGRTDLRNDRRRLRFSALRHHLTDGFPGLSVERNAKVLGPDTVRDVVICGVCSEDCREEDLLRFLVNISGRRCAN